MVMEIGVRVPCYRRWCRRAEAEAIATQAEVTGFASLWVQDHLVAPTGTREANAVLRQMELFAEQVLPAFPPPELVRSTP